MKRALLFIYLIITVSSVYSQCPNLLDSVGRKHGYWCEYRKESRWLLDTINVLVAEGNYMNGKKQGEWKYYPMFRNSDIAGSIHRVIYYPDSGQFIKSGTMGNFISEDSSYMCGLRRDTFLYTYCYRVDCASYLCIRRFPDVRFYYKKRIKDFESAYGCIQSKWDGYKIVKLKRDENPPGLIRSK